MSTNRKFQDLVAQISALQENEKGQLKGGFIAFKPRVDKEFSSAGDGIIICCNEKSAPSPEKKSSPDKTSPSPLELFDLSHLWRRLLAASHGKCSPGLLYIRF